MGKQGPCRHCGVTSTPLWRNGPPEKPVLCNACGSRWRTKGSLDNYTPMHARESQDSGEFTISKPNSVSFKPKDQKPYKKRQTVRFKNEVTYSGGTSNRSSSGSAISFSESCARFGTAEASDLAGSVQSIQVPSKKTTGATHAKPSSVEKLTKELHSIMNEQSYLSVSSEEDLLYGFGTPMNSYEIGHGSVLLSCLESKTVEEGSEATSLAIDNKLGIISETYSAPPSFPLHGESKGLSYQNIYSNELEKSTAEFTEEHVKREKVSNETLNVLRDRDSPLVSVDLKDIATYEIFMKHTTEDEQQRLKIYLSLEDTVKPPESLQIMFQSPQFMETFSYFRKLLAEGTFDLSYTGGICEPSRTLERLVLCNKEKIKWIEHYEKMKGIKHAQITGVKSVSSPPKFLAPIKRPYDHQNQQYPDLKGLTKSPRRVLESSDMNPPSVKLSLPSSGDVGSKENHDLSDILDNEGPCVSPRSIFASPPDQSSILASLQFAGESCDQDVQLGAHHSASFSEAGHFHPRNMTTEKNSSPSKGGVAKGERHFDNPSSSMSSQQRRRY